jgi:hypothetical protein
MLCVVTPLQYENSNLFPAIANDNAAQWKFAAVPNRFVKMRRFPAGSAVLYCMVQAKLMPPVSCHMKIPN